MPGVSRGPLDPAILLAPLLPFDRVALAVSGGADSLALMLLVDQLVVDGAASRDCFVVYTVDHALRPEAADEAAFVVREAERLGFAARVLRWDGAKPRTGIQAAARTARYQLFARAMPVDGVHALATAHHLHDQAETVLMRLAHGSGVEGLRGMDTVSELDGVTIVRPLLQVAPEALRALVDAAGLAPVADPGNSDLTYERVRWRQLLPQLAALGLDPRRLGLFARRLRDADDALEQMTGEALARIAFAADGHSAEIPRELLLGLPYAVAVRVVGRVLARVGDSRKPHALGQIERLTQELLEGRLRTTLHGCLVHADGRTIRLAREPGRTAVAGRRHEEPTHS